jgi:hypothetical protein
LSVQKVAPQAVRRGRDRYLRVFNEQLGLGFPNLQAVDRIGRRNLPRTTFRLARVRARTSDAPRRAAEEATGRYDDGLVLTIAVAYGDHDEITDAVRALLREAAVEGKALADAIETVTPAAIARHLYMAGHRAASGHDAAAPPSSVMNSRRFN